MKPHHAHYKKLVLATSSARRITLLRSLGVDFTVVKPRAPERVWEGDPRRSVLENARRKALSVVEMVPENSVIVAADTLVVDENGRILGKPTSFSSLASMIRALGGSWHTVVTGVYILDLQDKIEDSFIEETRVKFKPLSEEEVILYASSLEGIGKAGGYAIQGIASLLIEGIIGDYYNVVGLPLNKLYVRLKKMGIDLLREGVEKRILGRKAPL